MGELLWGILSEKSATICKRLLQTKNVLLTPHARMLKNSDMGDEKENESEPRKRPSPEKELITGLVDEVPSAKSARKYFQRKGKKFLKWLSLSLVVLLVIGYKFETSRIDKLKGQLSEVKQDRDKYQELLAPFQAMALKLYTNVPVEERMNFMVNQFMSIRTNILAALTEQELTFALDINNQPITNGSEIYLNKDRTITFYVHNESAITADQMTIDFAISLEVNPTNVILGSLWQEEPPITLKSPPGAPTTNTVGYQWRYVSQVPIAAGFALVSSPITIKTNKIYPAVDCLIFVSASRSKTESFAVHLHFQQNKPNN